MQTNQQSQAPQGPAASLAVYHFQQQDIRTSIAEDGAPWFVAADVCAALDISNVSDAIKRLDEDERASLKLGLPGGPTNVVSESGLYALILGSRKPGARAFKRWITHEVLPAIRRSGGYGRAFDRDALLAMRLQRQIALDLTRVKDQFVRALLLERVVQVTRALGQAVPDVALLGKAA